jgi:GNAT superfamily N-acetyltransferase
MTVVPLSGQPLERIAIAMRHGRPWLPESTDYWLWRNCFGDTSFLALDDANVVGGVLACVPQSRREELYVDQVAVDPQYRGKGVTVALFDALASVARARGCRRLWLSTDPANPAVRTWPRLGFIALGLHKDFKGPGKDRELFEKRL